MITRGNILSYDWDRLLSNKTLSGEFVRYTDAIGFPYHVPVKVCRDDASSTYINASSVYYNGYYVLYVDNYTWKKYKTGKYKDVFCLLFAHELWHMVFDDCCVSLEVNKTTGKKMKGRGKVNDTLRILFVLTELRADFYSLQTLKKMGIHIDNEHIADSLKTDLTLEPVDYVNNGYPIEMQRIKAIKNVMETNKSEKDIKRELRKSLSYYLKSVKLDITDFRKIIYALAKSPINSKRVLQWFNTWGEMNIW